jgi:sigma-B regulation protein RsbU (phosphoserine phosphatase)
MVFGEHDSERLQAHIAVGRNFLIPPFVPELISHQLTLCHSHRLLNQTLEGLTGDPSLLKYEQELQIGREIQRGFLPATLPRPDGWDLQVRFNPAREVAGDFYDSFPLVDDRRIAMVIADVCDKGVGAALFMALIRTLIRHTATHGAGHPAAGPPVPSTSSGPLDPNDPASGLLMAVGAGTLLASVTGTDSYMTKNHLEQGYFATLFFGILDPDTGHVIYINGGHNPPALLSADGALELLQPTGPAVGILPGSSFTIGQLWMQPGDVLFLYTDGVTEARAADGEFFGEERMIGVLRERPVRSAVELLDRMDAALFHHMGPADQYDDITMMALVHQPDQRKAVI